MTGLFANAIIALSLVLAAWSLVLAIMNKRLHRLVLVGAAVLELMLVAFLIGGLVQMAQTTHDFARLEFVGYLVGVVIIPPLGISWAWDDEARSGPVVALIVFLVVPVMILRVQQVWTGAGI